LAQVRKGLIKAAEQGLVDGTELNESWCMNLRNEIRNIVRAGAKRHSTKESKKDGKGNKKETKESKPDKKVKPAISGLQKYLRAQKDVEITASQKAVIDKLSDVQNAKGAFANADGELRQLGIALRRLMASKGRIGEDGKANPGDGSFMTEIGLNEDEQKSARTWDPFFFEVRAKAPRERSEDPAAAGTVPVVPT
jgi:hypothetical protein